MPVSVRDLKLSAEIEMKVSRWPRKTTPMEGVSFDDQNDYTQTHWLGK